MPKVRTGKKPEEPPKGAPSYMLTYGDMTTLLLVFFVALFHLGDATSDAKSIAALDALKPGVGVLDGSISPLNPESALLVPAQQAAGKKYGDSRQVSILKEQIEGAIKDAKDKLGDAKQRGKVGANEFVKGDFDVSAREGGIRVRLDNKALFDLGDAGLKDDFKQVLLKVAKFAKDYKMKVTVEGHTDDRPITTAQFPSNWELSAARATSVVRYMRDSVGMAPTDLTAIGRGEFYPRCTTDRSEECLAKNRRIELLLEPTAQTPSGKLNEATDLFGEGGLLGE